MNLKDTFEEVRQESGEIPAWPQGELARSLRRVFPIKKLSGPQEYQAAQMVISQFAEYLVCGRLSWIGERQEMASYISALCFLSAEYEH